MANYVEHLQPELEISYCKLVTVSTADVDHTWELRGGLGATWPFLSDAERTLIRELDIVDTTDKRYSPVAIPYTYVLDGNREIYKVYFGWWYAGRPTSDELIHDLRDVRSQRSDWGFQETQPPMTEAPVGLRPGDVFPDIELPDHDGQVSPLSQRVDGWPTALHFIRGHY